MTAELVTDRGGRVYSLPTTHTLLGPPVCGLPPGGHHANASSNITSHALARLDSEAHYVGAERRCHSEHMARL
jgi:hypothetical protein